LSRNGKDLGGGQHRRGIDDCFFMLGSANLNPCSVAVDAQDMGVVPTGVLMPLHEERPNTIRLG
jgi:hypothetical protein